MPIYKNRNGTYFVKICINNKQLMTRRYHGMPITNKEDAKKAENELFIQYRELKGDQEIDKLFPVFEKYMYKKFKETTTKRDLYLFDKRIKKYFIHKTISEINRQYLQYVCDSINAQDYKDTGGLINLAKKFLCFLSTYGLDYNANFMYIYRKNRIQFQRLNFYTLEEFKKFISVVKNPQDKLMFTMFFYYGLRCGELRALQVRDFLKDRITVYKSITNKGRFGKQKVIMVKTHSSVRDYPYVQDIKQQFNDLVKLNNLKPNSYIFQPTIKKDSLAIGETTIRYKIRKYSKKANVKTIMIHEFRHSCATLLINLDVDPKDIASWLGHSSVATTLQTYAHLLPTRKGNVKNIIDHFNQQD